MGIIILALLLIALGFSLIFIFSEPDLTKLANTIKKPITQIILVAIAIVLGISTHSKSEIVFLFLVVCSPTVLVAIAAIFFRVGFINLSKNTWLQLGASLGIITLLCWKIFDMGKNDLDIMICFGAFPALIFGLGATIGMTVTFPKWHKLAAVAFGVFLVLAIYFSFDIGMDHSSDGINRRNGEQIAAAIEQYKLNNGNYPETLELLIPEYFDELPEIKRYGRKNWLYTTNSEQYSLGFEYINDTYYCSICILSTDTSEWTCNNILDIPEWNVFSSPVCQPTPSPEPYNGTLEGRP